jgi:mycofactocin system glycosyltransferase
VRDQPVDLVDCLMSLEEIDYPIDRLEIIVVDDGSKKAAAQFVSSERVKIIRNDKSQGQAAARNTGAEKARGEILAFLDADCIAGKGWLKELVPFFQAAGTGAVGGFVGGFYNKSALDRYEEVSSSLNMGKRLIIEGKTESGFYVPTANLLVKCDVFMSAGGFKTGMSVGEDVDFCWRMRDMGHALIYAPCGTVAHKHRNRLTRMLKRRADYGTSESILYRAHRDKKKGMVAPLLHGLSFLALALAVLLLNPYPLIALPLLFGIDTWHKKKTLRNFNTGITLPQLAGSSLRSMISFYYFAFFHAARYYLALLLAVGFWWQPVWIWGGLAIVYASIVDYSVNKPRLFYPVYLLFYCLEHLAYQVGVFLGCVRARYFGSYIVKFKR